MKSFLAALQFLTIAPIRLKNIAPGQMARAVAYFPLAGLLLGVVLWAVNYFMASVQFEPLLSNVILVALLALLTGGLHMDALADTFDGIFSGKGRDETLSIMRDPHVGTMGVLAVVLTLMLKVALLSSVNVETKGAVLALTCVLSRYSMAIALFLFPYAREAGKAKVFVDGMNGRIFIAATIIALAVTFLISNVAGLAVLVLAAVFAYLANLGIKKKIGGVTGDTIGAVNELTEVVVLLIIIIMERVFA